MRLGAKLLATAGILGLIGTAGGASTLSALNDTTVNPNNSFVSGTVNISDNDAGTSLVQFSNGRPGTVATGCEKVTYTGTLPANVRIFATTTGNLTYYLNAKVTRGTFSGTPTSGSCTGFVADTTDYGKGPGVMFNDHFDRFPSTAGTGLLDASAASPTTWSAGDTRGYKIEMTLTDDYFGQGKSISTSFTWAAENT